MVDLKKWKDLLGRAADTVIMKSVDAAREAKRQYETGEGIVGKTRTAAGKAISRSRKAVETASTSFKAQFYTGDQFDKDRFIAYIDGKVDAVKDFGEEQYNRLVDRVRDGSIDPRHWLNDYVPTGEEERTRYAGIGEKYEGFVLVKPRLEACIRFQEEMVESLNMHPTLRDVVVQEIREYALRDLEELRDLYSRDESRETQSKLRALERALERAL